MSTIVQQLSYSINEKLRLDDPTFPDYEQPRNVEVQGRAAATSTSFSTKEPPEQWTAAPPSTSTTSSEVRFVGASAGTVAGQPCQRFDPQRILSIHRCELPPPTLHKSVAKVKDASETTVYKLRDSSSHKNTFPFNCQNKVHSQKSSTDLNSRCTGHSAHLQGTEGFPSVVGKSCTLHPPKDQIHSGASSSVFADVPPSKKHCRSVSELDNLGIAAFSSPWKPTQSGMWVPIQGLGNAGRSFLAYGRGAVDCSRSLDYGSLRSKESFGGSHFTPPASPVPRPASVTVIKQEGGAYTCISSQKVLSNRYHFTAFSPVSSPYCVTSPLSRSHDVGSKACSHSGLSATKRSLSFSADFEHRESIEYTPASTPELGKRLDLDSKRGGLLRCQSHPSGLNIKRSKCRRRSRFSNNRPTLDFFKMKQTSIAKQSRSEDYNRSIARPSFLLSNDNSQFSSVNPVFPSLISSDNTRKEKPKHLEPIRCLSPNIVPVSFSVGCSKPLSDIQHRIPSPTDEVPNEPDDDVDTDADISSPAVLSPFVPDCSDLNVDEIENEVND